MNLAKIGRIVRRACSWTIACAAVFAAVLVAAPSARAHGGVSIGIGFGFPAFIGVPVYAPPVYYVPPRFTIPHPMWVIMDRRLHTGVTITGYTIIVIAAVAINPTMHAAVWSISPAPAASPADMIAVPRLIPRQLARLLDPGSLLIGA